VTKNALTPTVSIRNGFPSGFDLATVTGNTSIAMMSPGFNLCSPPNSKVPSASLTVGTELGAAATSLVSLEGDVPWNIDSDSSTSSIPLSLATLILCGTTKPIALNGQQSFWSKRPECTCCLCMVRRIKTCFRPCGHYCACLRCAKKLKPSRCPICRQSKVTVLKLNWRRSRDVCWLCPNGKTNCCFDPCGHYCTCLDCAGSWNLCAVHSASWMFKLSSCTKFGCS